MHNGYRLMVRSTDAAGAGFVGRREPTTAHDALATAEDALGKGWSVNVQNTHTDNAAAVIYSFKWSGVARGQDVGGTGRGTRVFARQPDGNWLTTHEHISNGQSKT